MVQWFLFWKYKRKIYKQLKNADFKMKECASIMKSVALSEIDNAVGKDFSNLEDIKNRLGNRNKKIDVIMKFKDDFGVEHVRNYPPFSEDEQQSMRSDNRLYKSILTIFLISEMYLYYLTSEVLAPGNLLFKIAASVLFAVVTMILINFSMASHFKYIEAKKRREELGLKEEDIKVYGQKRIIGYVLLGLALAIILSAGYLRMTYLHTLDLSSYNAIERQAIEKMNFWVTILVFAVTFALAIYLAFLKSMHSNNITNYRVFKKWKHNDQMITKHKKNIGNIKAKFEDKLKNVTDKYWQLLSEFRTMFGSEYDQKFDAIKQDYDNFRKSGSALNDNEYLKYQDIQSYDEKLFKFGILNDEKVKDYTNKLIQAQELINSIDAKKESYKKSETI